MRIARFLATTLAMGLLATGCATLPDNTNRMQSLAYTDTADTTFGKGAATLAAAHPDQSGFHLLGNGLDAFVARAVLAHYAERSIDVQYYLYHNDLVGRLFTDLLLKAADRGVRVRLLVDDMDLADRDLGAAAMASHPNIEVRIFNPFSRNIGRLTQFVTRMGSVTRRMHNKSFTVDNQVAILGGRNIGDEYFDADPDLAFADLDVMAIGPVVKQVSSAFDLYWNSELAYPATALRGKPVTTKKVRSTAQSAERLCGPAG
jgi:putative cardiolipin synthase